MDIFLFVADEKFPLGCPGIGNFTGPFIAAGLVHDTGAGRGEMVIYKKTTVLQLTTGIVHFSPFGVGVEFDDYTSVFFAVLSRGPRR